MAISYIYNRNTYSTEAEVNAAVTALKTRLNNNPTDWVIVKEVTENPAGGWTISPETLSDEQILSLDGNKHYNVSAVYQGNTYVGLTAEEATAKIASIRKMYANYIQANTITKMYPPINENMSVYTT